MSVNKIAQRFGGKALVILAVLCVCLIVQCVRYNKRAREAELSMGVVLIVQEGLLSSNLNFIRSILEDSFDSRNLKPALALKYMGTAKILRTHILFMEKHGMDVSAGMGVAEEHERYATMLVKKHKYVSSQPAIQGNEEGSRRIVLPK